MLVGVFLRPCSFTCGVHRLPHARGGVSGGEIIKPHPMLSSPCSWGCFTWIAPLRRGDWVFPMLVGVFLNVEDEIVFETGLPHARGGVSLLYCYKWLLPWSSPCSWGCFLAIGKNIILAIVFPMLVGVFLLSSYKGRPRKRLPHARGGVSIGAAGDLVVSVSSPCSWGCFSDHVHLLVEFTVFPMLVGVFLVVRLSSHTQCCLPHARGGVSHG